MLPDQDFMEGTEASNIVIPCRGMARLHNVRGTTLHVTHGSAWITQSDSGEDVSLDTGESFCVTCNRRTLVAACHDAPFTRVALERPAAIALTLGERLRWMLFRVNAMPPNPVPPPR